MSLLEAVVLAIVEGLTEFLPVSSTGHMIIVSSLFRIASHDFTKTFTVCIQLGAIAAVVVEYRARLLQSVSLYITLAIAFVPAAVAGLAAGDYIDGLLERVDVVGYMLLAGGVFFLWVDRLFRADLEHQPTDVTRTRAFFIGCFQMLALVPGVSRSAATIIGGLTQGLNRKTAAEFSFLLAIPTMLAATGYKLLKFMTSGSGGFTSHEWMLLAVGNVIAFVVAWFAIRSFISFLTRHGFRWFGYYRIAVGSLILLMYYLGIQLEIV